MNLLPPPQWLAKYVFFTDPTYPTTNLVFVRKSSNGIFADVNLDCVGAISGWQPIGTNGLYEITKVDLIRGGRPVSYDKPARCSAEYRDCKWQKLEMNLYLAQYAAVRAPFCDHLVGKWDAGQPHARQAVAILGIDALDPIVIQRVLR